MDSPEWHLPAEAGGWRRFCRGFVSSLNSLVFPFTRRWYPRQRTALRADARRKHGYIIILPGIEGRSCFNIDLARGLADGGVRASIEIYDWTTGVLPLFLYHLRALGRNRRQASLVADRIVRYQLQFPGRPVHLIGHSGGGAIALMALEALPNGHSVTSAILINAALSPKFDITTALSRTNLGVWDFSSPFDVIFLALFVLVFGTVDGRHCPAAGMIGFRLQDGSGGSDAPPQLHQRSFRPHMAAQFNFGGHFGFTNRVFVAESIAPLIRE